MGGQPTLPGDPGTFLGQGPECQQQRRAHEHTHTYTQEHVHTLIPCTHTHTRVHPHAHSRAQGTHAALCELSSLTRAVHPLVPTAAAPGVLHAARSLAVTTWPAGEGVPSVVTGWGDNC